MPAPSSILGRQSLPLVASPINSRSTGSVHDVNRNSYSGNNVFNNTRNTRNTGTAINRADMATSSRPLLTSAPMYDEVFVSRAVSETKTMKWEIQDFNTVCTDRIERAMNFEFEMGRLGSMERHLPRRSRWKVMLDIQEISTSRIPAIRVLQLSPENKTIFYQLEACIVEKTTEELVYQSEN